MKKVIIFILLLFVLHLGTICLKVVILTSPRIDWKQNTNLIALYIEKFNPDGSSTFSMIQKKGDKMVLLKYLDKLHWKIDFLGRIEVVRVNVGILKLNFEFENFNLKLKLKDPQGYIMYLMPHRNLKYFNYSSIMMPKIKVIKQLPPPKEVGELKM